MKQKKNLNTDQEIIWDPNFKMDIEDFRSLWCPDYLTPKQVKKIWKSLEYDIDKIETRMDQLAMDEISYLMENYNFPKKINSPVTNSPVNSSMEVN